MMMRCTDLVIIVLGSMKETRKRFILEYMHMLDKY